MFFLSYFLNIRLDIVGFAAILGEGSVERNVQTLGASWHSKLPRLLPAPQALMKHERPGRLPTTPGTVVGAYSGNIRHDLNFFVRLMHPEGLEPFQVELCRVSRKALEAIPKGLQRKSRRHTLLDAKAQETGTANGVLARKLSRGTSSMLSRFTSSHDFDSTASYGPAGLGYLLGLSLVGFAMTIALVVLSVVYNDGMSLLSVVLLSAVTMLLGIGQQWELDIPPVTVNRDTVDLPSSDVVIYYPNGSIRVIRCSEEISRLYFAVERCEYSWNDTPYRLMALTSTIMLMFGLICLGNATEILQIAYAAAYILLNACYWLTSALNPVKHYWETAFHCTPMPLAEPLQHDTFVIELRRRNTWSERLHGDTRRLFAHRPTAHGHREETVPKRTFTRALWIAIALTGTSQWINHSTHIGPMTRAWERWHARAESKAIKPLERDNYLLADGNTFLPDWDYGRELSELLKDAREKEGKTNFKVAATAVIAAHRMGKGGSRGGGVHGVHGVQEEVHEVHEEVRELHEEMHGAGEVN